MPAENAFTARPDIKDFLKKVKHSHHVSKLGSKVSANPTTEQRAAFFGVITPSGTHQSRQEGGKGQPVEADSAPVHGTAPSVRTRNRKAGGVRD